MIILYRTSSESRLLKELLIKNKISFKSFGDNYNFYDNFICRDLLAYLKLSIDSTDKESFINIINKPYRYISKMNLSKLKQHKYKEDCFDYICSLNITNSQIKEIKKAQKCLLKIGSLNVKRAVHEILYKLDYYTYLGEYCLKNKISDLNFIVDQFIENSSKFNNISEYINHITEIGLASNQDNFSNIIISTIHAVKGMEFNNVLIMNCVEGCIPHEKSLDSNLEEERRVFYVAISRAIDNLYLFVPKTLNGNEKIVSRFINECELKT